MIPIVERGEKLGEIRSKHGRTLLARLGAGRCRRQRALMSGLAVLACLLGGCAFSSQLTPTQPAGVTQQLVMRSLERALAGLDISRFADRKVWVDIYLQSGNETFVKAFVAAWLERGSAGMPSSFARAIEPSPIRPRGPISAKMA